MKSSNSRKKIALITGASAGLGIEFARQIEKNNFLDEIWLVARRAEPMKDLAGEFQKSKGVILALDLTSDADLKSLKKKLETENPEVHFLVNNAGYGKIGPFAELGMEEQLKMVDLNVRTLTFLSHICLPFMLPGSNILQVASSIGFCPAPNFAVYAATKAYVVSLSEAMHFELKNRGISVTAICPGPVATEFFEVAQKSEYTKDKPGAAEPINNSFRANARDVVERALKDASKGRRRSVFGLPIKAFVGAVPFIPHQLLMKGLSQR